MSSPTELVGTVLTIVGGGWLLLAGVVAYLHRGGVFYLGPGFTRVDASERANIDSTAKAVGERMASRFRRSVPLAIGLLVVGIVLIVID
jgi:hypothetical protein